LGCGCGVHQTHGPGSETFFCGFFFAKKQCFFTFSDENKTETSVSRISWQNHGSLRRFGGESVRFPCTEHSTHGSGEETHEYP
jgi:hypothetical protein